jgi:hypothetical protein
VIRTAASRAGVSGRIRPEILCSFVLSTMFFLAGIEPNDTYYIFI